MKIFGVCIYIFIELAEEISGPFSLTEGDTVKIMLQQNRFLTMQEILERIESTERTSSDHIWTERFGGNFLDGC